jgi:hypothetical protein
MAAPEAFIVDSIAAAMAVCSSAAAGSCEGELVEEGLGNAVGRGARASMKKSQIGCMCRRRCSEVWRARQVRDGVVASVDAKIDSLALCLATQGRNKVLGRARGAVGVRTKGSMTYCLAARRARGDRELFSKCSV